MDYIGQTKNELHQRINLHRSQIKRNSSNSYEIKHFQLHSFNNIRIEILGTFVELKERLHRENDFILRYRSLYPYGLNTILNNMNIGSNNIYSFLNFFNKFIRINRGKRGSRVNSKNNNNIIPVIFLRTLEKRFMDSFDIVYIKNSIFSLRVKTLNKVKLICNYFKFKNIHFKDLVCDLVDFRLLKHSKPEVKKIFFTVHYQQKSFDRLNLNDIFKNFAFSFPISNCHIIPSFKYNKPFSKKVFNYRQLALNDNIVSNDSV